MAVGDILRTETFGELLDPFTTFDPLSSMRHVDVSFFPHWSCDKILRSFLHQSRSESRAPVTHLQTRFPSEFRSEHCQEQGVAVGAPTVRHGPLPSREVTAAPVAQCSPFINHPPTTDPTYRSLSAPAIDFAKSMNFLISPCIYFSG